MATEKKTLSAEDKKVIADALRLQQKSFERAARASTIGAVKDALSAQAVKCQSLANHVEYGQLDLG